MSESMILVVWRISPWEFYWSPFGIEYPGLCSDRYPFGPYDLYIRLNVVHLNKIHLVLVIPNFLGLFD